MAEQANGYFYEEAVQNHKKTKEEGRAIYDSVIMCSITIAGDKKSAVVKYADDALKARFPAAWQQFQDAVEQVGEGMPLEKWAMLDKARVMELKSLKIHTIEQLAGLNESFYPQLGVGARDLVEQAQAFICRFRASRVAPKA